VNSEEENDGRGVRGIVWEDIVNRGEKFGLNIFEGEIAKGIEKGERC
jgi:hypothetical protein